MIIAKVDEGIWRGPEPLTDSDRKQLLDLGVKFTLDLESGAHLLLDGSPLEEDLKLAAIGIRVLNHPLGEILPPTKNELTLALGVLVNYKPIYVHCKAGVDRTGMVCAWYKINILKWTREQAVNEMHLMGMHWWYYWWALRFL